MLLVAFVLPGFVTVLLQERTFKSAEDPTPFDRVLRTLYYSVWCYLLLAVVSLVVEIDRAYIDHLYDRYKDDPAHLAWRAGLVVLVPPLIVATATRAWDATTPETKVIGGLRKQLAARLRLNARHQQPTGWDYFFRQRHNVYVRVTMPDGSRVLGFYGAESFAAYAKDGGDLYLERLYAPDENGYFGPEAAGNHGVWIRAGEAVAVEFYNPHYESTSGSESSANDGDAGKASIGGARATAVDQ